MSPTTPRKSAKRNQITDSDDELTPPPASPGPSQSPPAKRLRRQRSPIASDIHSDDNDDDYDARESSPLSVLSSPSASPNPHKPSKSTTKRIKMADTARTSRSRATAKTKRSRGGSSQDTASAQVASETVKPASPLPSSAKSLSQPDPIPPKKKLGPIPKKGNGSSSNTPNPVAPTKPAKLSVPLAVRPTDLDESGSLRLGSKGGNKSASNDVDLSNSDVYKTLFGLNRSSNQKPGNSVNKASIPSGSGNREKDAARRAELAKLREEDRERRQRESVDGELLYEQSLQMAKFEEQLRARQSPACNGPVIYAAAFVR